jgi:antitoxin CptB
MSEKAKLKWHCRRGMRELDLLLEGFLEHRYEALSSADRDGFARLLDCPNEKLMDWLMEGGSPEDRRLAEIVQQIRDGAR